MQAISTRYHGPTNTRGSRITAKCAAGKVTIPYSYEFSGQQAHRIAAETLASKLGWTGQHYGKLAGGQLHNGDYAFVFAKHGND